MSSVEITPEYIEKLLAGDLSTYRLRGERAAMRAALGDAAALCDMLSTAVLEQNRRRGRTAEEYFKMSASFKRCGDEIWRMREKIAVPHDVIPATAPGQTGGNNQKDNSV